MMMLIGIILLKCVWLAADPAGAYGSCALCVVAGLSPVHEVVCLPDIDKHAKEEPHFRCLADSGMSCRVASAVNCGITSSS